MPSETVLPVAIIVGSACLLIIIVCVADAIARWCYRRRVERWAQLAVMAAHTPNPLRQHHVDMASHCGNGSVSLDASARGVSEQV
jgi:hypothetical protein